MAAATPLFELLQRNLEIFDGHDVVIAGDVLDPQILSLVKNCKSASLIVDNYVVAQTMAAMIGQSLDTTCPQVIEYKHVKLFFSDVETALKSLDNYDSLVLLLSKNKQQSLKLLNKLTSKLNKDGFIYTAGTNDGGGKSADTLLKVAGHTKKLDLARKCTLFKAIFENDFYTFKEPQDLKLDLVGNKVTLKQDPAVFSQGKLDNGTAMLIEALQEVTPFGCALDLGCGCGVVGIALDKMGFKNITSCDVSAAALELTKINAETNQASIKVVASDMLQAVDKYDLIAVNPPFHVGIQTTIAPTVNMIMNVKDHLTENGVFYMVANGHLGYEEFLKENFAEVEVVKKSTTFVVYKAHN